MVLEIKTVSERKPPGEFSDAHYAAENFSLARGQEWRDGTLIGGKDEDFTFVKGIGRLWKVHVDCTAWVKAVCFGGG